MSRIPILYVICATIAACQSSANQASADLVGPMPYLQASDSPFVAFTFDFFHLEDFEDEVFNVPGVIKSAGSVIGPGLAADSVDADDGTVDGSGNGGRSLFVAGGALTFTFDPSVLGGLPTHVGIVRTDGGSTATGPRILFEAFGPGMNSLGTISAAFGDGNSNGGTAEDRFLGWFDPNGILAIRVPSGVFEVDHLQFGSSVPEPSTVALFVCAIMVAGLFKLRTVRRLQSLRMAALAAALVGPLAFYTNAAAMESFFLGLGDLPGGTFDSRAFGVSADGSVVVGSTGDAPGAASAQAFRWTRDTSMVGLGEPSSAYDISADGSVIVGQWGSQAFRWTQETGLDGLGDLPRGAFFSFANAVSADGSVVVGLGSTDFCPRGCVHIYPPFRWTPNSGMARLGMPIERRFDHRLALDVSADGLVIVGGATEASMWTQMEGSIGLGDLPGGPDASSRAYGVSADGTVIVGVGDVVTDSGGEAFRWTQNSGMVGLGILPGFDFSVAQDVSADGSIVVGTLGLATESAGAFIWDATHGMRNVQDVLVNSIGFGASLAGWTLSDATAISADGRVVVGYGTNPDGNTEAWIASIEPAPLRPGDFNNDGAVDAADYVVWRKGLGNDYTQNDYNLWRAHFGRAPSEGWSAGSGEALPSAEPLQAAVPEPATLRLVTLAVLFAFHRFFRRYRHAMVL
jgi:probable HAF family extracellular repeat protein